MCLYLGVEQLDGGHGMRLKAVLLILLFFIAIGTELVSYSLPIIPARIVLVTAFVAMLSLVILMHKLFADSQSPFRKMVVFSGFFVTSILFVLRRYLLLLPSRIELVVTSEIFAVAETMGSSGLISFNSPHSYIFQRSFLLNLLREGTGLSFSQIFCVTLLIQAIIVAFAGMFFYELLRKKFDINEKGYAYNFLPPLLAFSLISCASSERADIGLSLFLLFMCFVFAKGLTSRGNFVVLLLSLIHI